MNAPAPLKTPATDNAAAEVDTIGSLLAKPKYRDMLIDAVRSTPLNPERFIRIMSNAVMRNKDLAKCTPISLFGAMMASAFLGLEPNTPLQHAYLLPFNNRKKIQDEYGKDKWIDNVEIQFIIGYKGYKELAHRSGDVRNIHADVVYEGDEFDFAYGSKQFLHHKPQRAPRDGRKPLWGYCYVSLKDGFVPQLVLPIEEIDKAKQSSSAYRYAHSVMLDKGDKAKAWLETPWVKYEHDMRTKTAVRRLFSSGDVPISVAMAEAIGLDIGAESGRIDYTAFVKEGASSLSQITHTVTPKMDPVDIGGEDSAGNASGGSPEKDPARRKRRTKAEIEADNAAAAAAAAQPAADGPPPGHPAAGDSQPQAKVGPDGNTIVPGFLTEEAKAARVAQEAAGKVPTMTHKEVRAAVGDDDDDDDMFSSMADE